MYFSHCSIYRFCLLIFQSTWIRAISPPNSPTPEEEEGEEEDGEVEDYFNTSKSFDLAASPPSKKGRKSPSEEQTQEGS